VRTLGDCQIDDDPTRIDRDALWSFLSGEAYWGRWRTRDVVDRQIDGAWRVVGVYDSAGAMVGFARAVSDGYALGYLADVYVLAPYRGRGLGQALVEEMIDRGPGRDFRWLLHTRDAHDLYRRSGFAEPDSTLLERPARQT
jgi:ribosomal protein S18 acetylase RimI-like enzyme